MTYRRPAGPRKIGAYATILQEALEADARRPRRDIREDSRRITEDLVLSILWWTNEEPLEVIVERDEGRAYRRSHWRKD